MKKRVIAFLLSVCLSFSICAGTAFAEEPANTVDQIEKQAEVSIDPVAADEEEPSSTPDDSEVLTPVPAPDFSENGDAEEPADETPAEDEPEITVPDAEAPTEDVLPDENIEDTTEITDDMTEEEEFEEEESELGTYDGDTMAKAEYLPTNTPRSATFSSSTAHCSYWYRLDIQRQGTISAILSHEYLNRSQSIIDFYFMDSNGIRITDIYTSTLNSMETEIPSIGIAPGTYYLVIDHGYHYQDINYTFKVNYTICDNYEVERNNTIYTATNISPGKKYYGRLNRSGDEDYYKITAPSDGYFTINFFKTTSNPGNFDIRLYDQNLGDWNWLDSRSSSNCQVTDIKVGVQKGSYYFYVFADWNQKDSLYAFTINFTKTSTYEKERNDSDKTANTIPLNTTISGTVLGRVSKLYGNAEDDTDWFKFTASKKTYYSIRLIPRSNTSGTYYLSLQDSTFNNIKTLDYRINSSSPSEDYRVILNPGVYYIKITSSYSGNDAYDFYVKQSTVTPSPVTDFVSRLYKYCLNRDPDDSGLSYWASLLSRKELTGAQVAQNFVFSPEFLQQNIDNYEFMNRLYLAFFGREYDRDGRNYWINCMRYNGMSRRTVAANFINSAEFLSICNSYGIVRGSIGSSGTSATRSQIESYVKRCYTQILGRSGDSDGINYWTTLIQNGQSRPVDVAKSFVGSREFSLKQLNNTEFVKVMYRAFMGREYDTGGLNYWVNQMNRGMSKNEVLNNFANSKEFSLIMNSMGV